MVVLVCSGGRGQVKRMCRGRGGKVEGVEERWGRQKREGGRIREKREKRVNQTRVLKSKKKEGEVKDLVW